MLGKVANKLCYHNKGLYQWLPQVPVPLVQAVDWLLFLTWDRNQQVLCKKLEMQLNIQLGVCKRAFSIQIPGQQYVPGKEQVHTVHIAVAQHQAEYAIEKLSVIYSAASPAECMHAITH